MRKWLHYTQVVSAVPHGVSFDDNTTDETMDDTLGTVHSSSDGGASPRVFVPGISRREYSPRPEETNGYGSCGTSARSATCARGRSTAASTFEHNVAPAKAWCPVVRAQGCPLLRGLCGPGPGSMQVEAVPGRFVVYNVPPAFNRAVNRQLLRETSAGGDQDGRTRGRCDASQGCRAS